MQIRRLNDSEKREAALISIYAFHVRPDDLEKSTDYWAIKNEEDWGAFTDDGTLTARIINNRYTMNFDGRQVRAGGIGAVSTLPEYRNSGAIREMFTPLLTHAYEQGEVLSALFPFSHSFYRKFGYETTCCRNIYTFAPDVLKGYRFGGEAVMWKEGGSVEEYTRIYNAFAADYNLSVVRSDKNMSEEHIKGIPLKDRVFTYLLKEGGEAVAYVTFTDVYHDPAAILRVEDLAWVSPAGFNTILGFLSRFGADYGSIELMLPVGLEFLDIVECPETYAISKKTSAAFMTRVVNVAEALKIISKPEGCSFTIKVEDDILTQNSGVWSVNGDTVERNDAVEPDMTVDIRTFSQLAVGAVSLDNALLKRNIAVGGNIDTLRKVFVRKPLFITDNF